MSVLTRFARACVGLFLLSLAIRFSIFLWGVMMHPVMLMDEFLHPLIAGSRFLLFVDYAVIVFVGVVAAYTAVCVTVAIAVWAEGQMEIWHGIKSLNRVLGVFFTGNEDLVSAQKGDPDP